MIDKVANDARVYTDIQGLENLRYESKNHPEAAKKEVANQFEAIMMQQVLRSMRDANKAFASDLFGSDQMDFYEDLFDKQLSMLTSNSGLGFAQIIEKNINQQYFPELDNDTTKLKSVNKDNPKANASEESPSLPMNKIVQANYQNSKASLQPKDNEDDAFIHGPEDFIKKLWSSAKVAASLLGTDPKILLAQAALETNWGKKILPATKDKSSFNLFNIKADNSWNEKTVSAVTLEQKNGVIAKESANFRTYGSYVDSFKDYVKFIKEHTRYSEAISAATDPKQYIEALQKAGFATDNKYAEKILKIFSSNMFNKLVQQMQ